MTCNEIRSLNERFAIAGHVEFLRIEGDLPAVQISNASAAATVSLHGGHVLAFQPSHARQVLWMSQKSRFAHDAPIRGGIPVCWPWFGRHADDPAKPSHGFARIFPWTVAATRALSAGETHVELRLADSENSRLLWPHAFELRLLVKVSSELEVALCIHNPGTATMRCSSALHSYFTVSDISTVQVTGLEECRYVNTVPDPHREEIQKGPILFAGETDRIYLDTESDCMIRDPGLKRRIRVSKQGSRSTVVWNPWIAKAARMPDFGDHEWPEMVCIETANALTDTREIGAGATHRLSTRISVEPL